MCPLHLVLLLLPELASIFWLNCSMFPDMRGFFQFKRAMSRSLILGTDGNPKVSSPATPTQNGVSSQDCYVPLLSLHATTGSYFLTNVASFFFQTGWCELNTLYHSQGKNWILLFGTQRKGCNTDNSFIMLWMVLFALTSKTRFYKLPAARFKQKNFKFLKRSNNKTLKF